MDRVESAFATASFWGDMSLSKHHNLDAPSMMTSDNSLSCLPNLLPHSPCSQQPARQLLRHPNSPLRNPPSQGPPSTVPTAAAPGHPSSSYPESAVSTPLSPIPEPPPPETILEPNQTSKNHHPPLWAHWPRLLPHPNANPPQDSAGIEDTHGQQMKFLVIESLRISLKFNISAARKQQAMGLGTLM